jgi:hypothetical protein
VTSRPPSDRDIEARRNYPVTTMRFQPTITFEQFRDTCQAVTAAKPKRVPHRSWKEYLLLAIVCLVLGVTPQVPVARVPAFTILAVMIVLWIVSKPLAKRSQERCLRDIYAEEQSRLNGQVLTIDESGIACDQVNGNATSHQKWQSFIKRIDMPDAFVFLSSPNHFVHVPKEMLSSSDRESIWQWSSMIPTAGER